MIEIKKNSLSYCTDQCLPEKAKPSKTFLLGEGTCKNMNCYSCKTKMISNRGPPESSEIINIPDKTGSRETIWVFEKALTIFGNLKRFLFT